MSQNTQYFFMGCHLKTKQCPIKAHNGCLQAIHNKTIITQEVNFGFLKTQLLKRGNLTSIRLKSTLYPELRMASYRGWIDRSLDHFFF